MTSGLHFLLLARHRTIADLRLLASASELVQITSRLIHGLQRERGLSTLFLGVGGDAFSNALHEQTVDCQQCETALRRHLAGRDAGLDLTRGSARLYGRIALALEGLDKLPTLRVDTRAHRLGGRQVVNTYARIIDHLMRMVFEAADSATDPDISRLLIALFHFMQGKELAGQERAEGVALLTGTVEAAESRAHLIHLADSREHYDRVFADFASPTQLQFAQAVQDPNALAEQKRLRRLLLTASLSDPFVRELGPAWFGQWSTSIDAMRRVEDRLAIDLLTLCEQRIDAAKGKADEIDSIDAARRYPSTTRKTPAMRHFGPHLERSILDLALEQADRLLLMQTELEATKKLLSERKLIERAKGVLMAHRQLGEAAAHKTMRSMAMSSNRRLVDVAKAILAVSDRPPGDSTPI